MAPKDILTRIRRVLALAEAQPGTAEGDLAQATAERMIADYGITETMLAASGTSDDTNRIIRIRRGLDGDAEIVFKVDLVCAVASMMGCVVLSLRGPDGVTFLGFEAWGHATDLARAEALFASLLVQAEALCAVDYPHSTEPDFRANWWVGFILAVQQRIKDNEIRAQVRAEQTRVRTGTFGPSVAVAVRDRDAAVGEAVREHYRDKLVAGEEREVPPHGAGRFHGYRAGQEVSFGENSIAAPSG